MYRILALGDVVGAEGVGYLSTHLRQFKKERHIDFVVVNAENCAPGNGIDQNGADALLESGADVLTTGNHVYRIASFSRYLEDSRYVIRPANFPSECPGRGYTVCPTAVGNILVINVQGVTFMEPLASPFDAVEQILADEKDNFSVSLLDVHAESTSEKAALARYFDGRLTAVFGTHTHVQTADARVLPKNTGFITDLGMCGPAESILGVLPERVIDRLRLHLPRRFDYASGVVSATGAVFTVDKGKTVSVEAVTL